MIERIRKSLKEVVDCFRLPEDVEAKDMFARTDGSDESSRGGMGLMGNLAERVCKRTGQTDATTEEVLEEIKR